MLLPLLKKEAAHFVELDLLFVLGVDQLPGHPQQQPGHLQAFQHFRLQLHLSQRLQQFHRLDGARLLEPFEFPSVPKNIHWVDLLGL